MKMVKSLLLGSAAAAVAFAGAQAADLPVKAKPVEYVKVCSLYGAGFYYMPGTDICLKIGGYVRFQMYGHQGQTGTTNAFHGTSGYADRLIGNNNDFVMRTRAVLTADTRQQTEYGTLRTYTLIGFNHDTNPTSTSNLSSGAALYATRGFIQLAGFTFGKAQSFFDIFSNPAISYFAIPGSDTGDSGIILAGYTAQFGNGFTGTISIEDPSTRRTAIAQNTDNTGAIAALGITLGGAQNTNNYGNIGMPDVVGALRVDQAWGSAQVMAAIHEVRPDYYTDTNSALGHPGNELGWVVGVGARLKADAISRGDTFQFQVNYTEGALRYLNQTQFGSNAFRFSGSTLGLGLVTDGIFAGATGTDGSSVELTKGWSVNASYEHIWNQKWKTSIYGGLVDVQYSDRANQWICGRDAAGVVLSNCNADWGMWWVGSRTQFNINSSTYLGLDVIYQKLESMSSDALYTGAGSHAGLYSLANQEQIGVTFRIHRDFLP